MSVGIEPMEAKLVSELPEEPGWQFEPKWDGFRCLAYRAGGEIDLRAKSGKPLARYFPEVVALLASLKPSCFVLDGELAIPLGGTLSFDALQQRHPSRREPHQEARGRDAGDPDPVRYAARYARAKTDREVAHGSPRRARELL